MSSGDALLQEAMEALRRDLIHEDGPRISTMRNYRFAILQYPPDREFALRRAAQRLSHELMHHGWRVLSLDLQKLLLDRVRAQGEDWVRRVIDMERRMGDIAPGRGLNYLSAKLAPLIEGPEGLAADCSRLILADCERHPEQQERALALIGRAGGLYPFYRTSALLKHLDGRTGGVPVVLLYPGTRQGNSGLSFMGRLASDNDYRPRIYP